jgi:hypothetical protein
MLSKQVIMREWRAFVQRRDNMALINIDSKLRLDSAPPNSPDSTHPPGSPARAEASLFI